MVESVERKREGSGKEWRVLKYSLVTGSRFADVDRSADPNSM